MANHKQFLMVQNVHPHISIVNCIDGFVTDIHGYHPHSFNKNYYYEEDSFFDIEDLQKECPDAEIVEFDIPKDSHYFGKIKELVKELQNSKI